MTRRVLIVDDEALARDRLRDLLAELDEFEIVGECERGDAAVEAIGTLAPHIVLLDVQMPGLDGFDVLDGVADTVAPELMPIVIFVTAYDQYAIRAFEASALDYLQKPVARHRLATALDRAGRQLDLRDAASVGARPDAKPTTMPGLAGLRAATRATRGYATRFAVKRGDAVQFVRPEEIDWIDAAGNYVRLHVRGGVSMLRSTIGEIEARLDPHRFLRIHRSAIVNLDRVTKIESFTHGEYVLVAADGARLRSSRAHSARLRELVRTGVD
jgi:two-component system LytT family response regulator